MRAMRVSKATRVVLSVAVIAIIAEAKVPYSFSVGQVARSGEVNENFAFLDSSVSTKAERTSLDSLKRIVESKSDTSSVSAARKEISATKTDLSLVKTQLGALRNDAWILGRISDTAKELRRQIGSVGTTPSFPASYIVQGPNDIINGAPWYGIGLSDMKSDANFLVQLGGYYGLNLQTGGGYPIKLNSATHPVASFNYDTHSLYVLDKQIARFAASGLALSGNLSVSGGIVATGDLNVSGSITAKAVTQVPDYVFEPGYALSPLSEVESFIRTNRHLPDVPSASEIESKGVDLAEMNLLLLKKVEELTLHAVAQEKLLRRQESTIATQEDRLRALEARLENLAIH